jgi:hypothetical protein
MIDSLILLNRWGSLLVRVLSNTCLRPALVKSRECALHSPKSSPARQAHPLICPHHHCCEELVNKEHASTRWTAGLRARTHIFGGYGALLDFHTQRTKHSHVDFAALAHHAHCASSPARPVRTQGSHKERRDSTETAEPERRCLLAVPKKGRLSQAILDVLEVRGDALNHCLFLTCSDICNSVVLSTAQPRPAAALSGQLRLDVRCGQHVWRALLDQLMPAMADTWRCQLWPTLASS